MQVNINGKNRDLEANTNLAALIELLDLQGKRIAIEINRQIVPRSQYPERRLNDQDQIEIVGAIGGG